jgi:pimeloyl-ACP methyl ester carboxylesterase
MSEIRREREATGRVDGLFYELLRPAADQAGEPNDAGGAEANVLVALPGFLSDGRQLKRLLREVGRRCLVLDPIGAGRSDAAVEPGEYAWPRQVERLLRVLDHLRLERVDVLGVSMGGMWLQHALLAAPQRVEQAIFVATCAALSPRQRSILLGLQSLWQARVSRLDVWRVLAPLLFSVEFLERPSAVALLEMLASDPRSHSAGAEEGRVVPLRQLGAMQDHDARQALTAWSTTAAAPRPRCTVIGCEQDILMPLSSQRELAACLAADLQMLPTVGHTVWLEQPSLLAGRLRRVLSAGVDTENRASQLTAGAGSG